MSYSTNLKEILTSVDIIISGTTYLTDDLEPIPIKELMVPHVCMSSFTPRALDKEQTKDVTCGHSSVTSDDPFHRMLMNVSPVDDDETTRPTPPPKEAHSRRTKRSRKLQPENWQERFEELLQFRQKHGHFLVPNSFPPNQQLAQWVKRQRYQYKLKHSGHHSTLSNDREALLNSVGFVWDSHATLWFQRFQDLKNFQMVHGHCNVPPNYHDASLGLWAKHQRRQFRLARKNLDSTLTEERFNALNSIGFDWNPRNLKESS
jgi:hypothetical protein